MAYINQHLFFVVIGHLDAQRLSEWVHFVAKVPFSSFPIHCNILDIEGTDQCRVRVVLQYL